jgi:cell wall-associated NlpC family hydrolase
MHRYGAPSCAVFERVDTNPWRNNAITVTLSDARTSRRTGFVFQIMASFTPPRRFAGTGVRVLVALCAAALLLSIVPAARGAAAPIDDQRAEAQRLEAEINETSTKIAALYEQIKFNQDALEAAQQTIAKSESEIATAQAEVQRVLTLVRERAVATYERSGSTGLEDLQTNTDSVASRRKYAEATNARDNTLLDKLAKAKEHLSAERDAAEKAKGDAQAHSEALQQQQASFESMQNEQEQLLAQVNGEIGRLVAEEQAKRAAAEAPKIIPAGIPSAGATTPTTSGADSASPSPTADPDPAPAPAPEPPPPTASGRGDSVVAYAAAQLGKPYCYAGAGPSCFDCSGLTMQAWAQVGVYMAHNSEAQYAAFRRVPMNALLPGDIVWNPGHVGIYVGGGAVIHAPHTGDVVRYIDVGYFQAAVRPG